MPYLTTRKNLELELSPGLVGRLLRHPARKRSGSILGRNTHTPPRPTRGGTSTMSFFEDVVHCSYQLTWILSFFCGQSERDRNTDIIILIDISFQGRAVEIGFKTCVFFLLFSQKNLKIFQKPKVFQPCSKVPEG